MLDKNKLLKEIYNIKNQDELQEFHQNYLSKKWVLSQEFKTMGQLDPEERKNKWQILSDLKASLEEAYWKKEKELRISKINEELENEIIDISIPWCKIDRWHYTLISKTRRETEEIFRWMGFIVEYWNDIVTKYENFYSVNIPSTHPATEMHDTFYLNQTDWDWDNLILRTHTSCMQNQLIKKYWVPLKIVVPWKVYRYENTDASHDTVFWQIEWLVIDKDISIAHFKDNITKILSSIFKTEIWIRMRPAFFPFVEPGFEIDASCPICSWKWCSLCKHTWWIEILWAGMVHPNVLKEAEVNPDEYRWFAFGMWLTRLVAIKYWINDVRLFTNWDLRFVKSFY